MGDDYEIRPKKFRKRKKGEGDEIFNMLAKDRAILDLGHDKGLRCKTCGKWRAWRDIHTKYEPRGTDYHRLWFCPDCGDMLKEDNVSDLSIQHSTDEQRVVVFSGDRNWTDVAHVARVLERYDPFHTTIRHGACRGLDRIAGELAKNLGFEVDAMPADWDKHHRAAGAIRNQAMLDKEPKPVRVHLFHDDLENSKGTKRMAEQAKRAGVPRTLHMHKRV